MSNSHIDRFWLCVLLGAIPVLFYAFDTRLALAQGASVPAATTEGQGMVLSLMSGTQGNFGLLHIGAGYMGGGPFLDEKGVRRDGLHAGLSISVSGAPEQFSQPDVVVGQTIDAAGYRITIVQINPGPPGSVVFRLSSLSRLR
jgi:hypothetical protein